MRALRDGVVGMIEFTCDHCGRKASRPTGHVNRQRARGMNLYCSRKCSGLGRRSSLTKAEKKELKRLYDQEYREKNNEYRSAQKREYHRRTYDPAAAKIKRKELVEYHNEYCRQPEYRKWKAEYDKKYRANRIYGPFAEAFLLLMQVETEIKERATDYEIRQENGTSGKTQQRRREDGADGRGRGYRKTADRQ
jgi:hypothetical protein